MRCCAVLGIALASAACGGGGGDEPDGGSPDASSPASAVRYPDDRTQSPITAEVAANLVAIAARGAADEKAFSKIGDSITEASSFLHCFAGSNVDLGSHAA